MDMATQTDTATVITTVNTIACNIRTCPPLLIPKRNRKTIKTTLDILHYFPYRDVWSWMWLYNEPVMIPTKEGFLWPNCNRMKPLSIYNCWGFHDYKLRISTD